MSSDLPAFVVREHAAGVRLQLGSIVHGDGACDVGKEDGALVADDYPVPNAFTGEINWVEIDVGDAAVDADHRLEPDELLRVAMARQ